MSSKKACLFKLRANILKEKINKKAIISNLFCNPINLLLVSVDVKTLKQVHF